MILKSHQKEHKRQKIETGRDVLSESILRIEWVFDIFP